jgi:hypothetical protein
MDRFVLELSANGDGRNGYPRRGDEPRGRGSAANYATAGSQYN